MTAHTVPVTASGATIAVSASIPATYDAAGYGATSIVYTAIGNVSDHGAHGVTAAITKFTPVDTATVSKVKGSKDYGSKSLKIANIAGDAGQVIMKAASESTAHYSFCITYSDTEKHYLDALVSKYEYQDGSVDSVREINCVLEICRAPVIVAAS